MCAALFSDALTATNHRKTGGRCPCPLL